MFEKRKYPAIALQKWRNIFFLHWHVDERCLQRMIPEPFIVDTFSGQAWITIVIFQAKYSRPRLFPQQFSLKEMYQINVRTYVMNPIDRERGVYFFALRVGHPYISPLMGKMFSLPFIRADITCEQATKRTLSISCIEKEKHAFQSTCTTTLKPHHSPLATFLAERYCIWNVHDGKIIKLPLSHSSWDLFQGDTTVLTNKIVPLEIEEPPFVHYAKEKTAYIHPFETYGYYRK